MRSIYLLTLVAGSLLAMNNSCKKEDDAQPCLGSVPLASAQVPGLQLRITEPIPNAGQSNEYIVNSASEYRELFGCAAPTALDFTTHTLLAGKTKTASCSHVLAQQVVQTCAGYTYTIKLEAAAGQDNSSISYYVVVPKIPTTASVAFNVQLPPLAAKSVELTSER